MNPIAELKEIYEKIHKYVLFMYKDVSVPQSTRIRGIMNIRGTKHPNIILGENIAINSSVRSNQSGGENYKYSIHCI